MAGIPLLYGEPRNIGSRYRLLDYSNHLSDPGGRTNFGITIADYRAYVKPDATADDVRNMTVDDAKRIYRKRYWDAQRCDELPGVVDFSVFDYGVNSGIGRSGKALLRRVVGLPDNTSVITDQVLAYLPIVTPAPKARRDLVLPPPTQLELPLRAPTSNDGVGVTLLRGSHRFRSRPFKQLPPLSPSNPVIVGQVLLTMSLIARLQLPQCGLRPSVR
jgi:Glycosyl hydrolase 108